MDQALGAPPASGAGSRDLGARGRRRFVGAVVRLPCVAFAIWRRLPSVAASCRSAHDLVCGGTARGCRYSLGLATFGPWCVVSSIAPWTLATVSPSRVLLRLCRRRWWREVARDPEGPSRLWHEDWSGIEPGTCTVPGSNRRPSVKTEYRGRTTEARSLDLVISLALAHWTVRICGEHSVRVHCCLVPTPPRL